MDIKDEQFRDRFNEITHDSQLTNNQKRAAVGKALRETVARLKGENKSNAEIAEALGLEESRVGELAKTYDAHNRSNMWYPGLDYEPRLAAYDEPAHTFSADQLVELVQDRAKEDGEWSIENGHVGNNEDVMHKMMEWVSRPETIIQCADANLDKGVTVDWVCRELAQAAQQIAGGAFRD